MKLKGCFLLFKMFLVCTLALFAMNTASYAVETPNRKAVPIHIKATRLDSYNKENKIIFTGDVIAKKAEQNVILTGDPKVWEGNSMIKGSKITVFLDEDRSIVESREENRVEAIIY